MNTKEAIELIGTDQNDYIGCDYWKKIREVIKLLKRGKKYEKMWEEFKKEYNVDYNLIELGYLDINYANQKDLNIIMEDLEQKYFPKEES